MPYTLVHDGRVREFEMFMPFGWQLWLDQAVKKGRQGLPLVVALHGGGEDPYHFMGDWQFPNVWGPVGKVHDLENQFIFLVPFGFAMFDLPDPKLGFFAPEAQRVWNGGFEGVVPTTQDDVGFIQTMIETAENLLVGAQSPSGDFPASSNTAFDPKRRYLFGYSVGGELAYRLVAEMPDYWAALWIMSSTIGGTAHYGRNGFPVVKHSPSGTKAVSLFHHHGLADGTIPPQTNVDPLPGETEKLCRTVDGIVILTDAGLNQEDAEDLAPAFLPIAAAVSAYRLHNNTGHVGTATSEPSVTPVVDIFVGDPSAPAPGEPPSPSDISLGSIEVYSTQTVYPPGALNEANPQVVKYLDPQMTHTNFTSDPDRYFHPEDVWEFFWAHPLVDL